MPDITRSTLRTLLGAATLALGVAALSPASAQAQQLRTIEVTPVIGGAFFPSKLAEPFKDEEGNTYNVSLGNAAVFGLNFGFNLSEQVALEVQGLKVPTQLSVSTQGASAGADMGLYLIGGAVRYAFAPVGRSVRPFVVAGAGIKGYDGGTTDAMWNLGGGIRLPLGNRIGLRLELRDYMSRYDSIDWDRPARLQHDLLFMPGLVFSL
jgi:hypothetical protein